jgi:hypothetical protein
MGMEPKRPMTLYVSYSQKDEALKQEFEDYLVNLQQAQLISGWIERQVQPGADWSQVIDPQLEMAQIFLLLLSPSLLASGYCSGAEFQEAFEQRRRRGEMRVIPIFLHHVDVTWHPLGSIVSLPIFVMERSKGMKPVSSWPERHEAWWSVYQDLRQLIRSHPSGSLWSTPIEGYRGR